MKPTAIDIFTGGGGSSEGFRQAGFEIILGIDKEPRMLASFRANHPETEVWERDVLTIDPSELPDADVIIGSPPCQDFSTASSKKNPEKGMVLVNWMLDVVREKKPKFWVMENVPPVAKYLPKWILVVNILHAVKYGVPQTRRRCFAGDYPVPKPTHNNGPDPQPTLDGGMLKPWVTVRDAIGDLPSPTTYRSVKQLDRTNEFRGRIGLKAAPDPIDKPSRTILGEEGKSTEKGMILIQNGLNCAQERPMRSLDEPSFTIRGDGTQHRIITSHELPSYEAERAGKRKMDVPFMRKNPPLKMDEPSRAVKSHLAKAPKELLLPVSDAWMRKHPPLDPNRSSSTIVPKVGTDSERYCHPKVPMGSGYRRLTVREAARLQSFPDDYEFIGPLTWQYKQIGEAVPPLLARRLAEEMLRRWND